MTETDNVTALIAAAKVARENAYAPYSRFAVGAALEMSDGRIITGCNVENVSFGLTMCAERVAIATAISEGEQEFAALALVADSQEPVVPCGACRQVISEFNPQLRIVSVTISGAISEFRLDDLFPRPRQGILG